MSANGLSNVVFKNLFEPCFPFRLAFTPKSCEVALGLKACVLDNVRVIDPRIQPRVQLLLSLLAQRI